MIVVQMILIIGAIFLLLREYLLTLKGSNKKLINNSDNPRFAVLVPAKDESLVIEDLLNSLEEQSYKIDKQNIYVITESLDDPTNKIVLKHGNRVIVRRDFTYKCKGGALDEAIKFIISEGKHYDAYFIFDADNILDKDFFKEMKESFIKGYDVGIGYRNAKNGNDNIYAAASSLTFSMINTLGNNFKMKHGLNLTVSGTGFYIKGDILENLGGYPFYSLTEDYEFSLYAVLNDLTMAYNRQAKYYDEQPVNYETTIKQRTRWVKGYFMARRMYYKALIKKLLVKDGNYSSVYSTLVGVVPYILLILALVLEILKNVVMLSLAAFNDKPIGVFVNHLLFILAFVYLVLLMFTLILLIKERDSLKLKSKTKIKVLFYNPVFLAEYVKCLYLAIKNKDLTWEKIPHTVKINEELEKEDIVLKK